ncbi:putative translational transactivator [Water chestnut soymovirus 1]|uniref:Putative translational transactivator n=1 Tax=Water chestnut soymovirus 1 TaxID=1848040 RepID=A0A172PC80_9VIRU|nr:putative translational transactivator [Water chestnut soymovirus 1]AND65753.1 putative translational transactivator [Water chestnut soymovirus 1]
MEHLRKWRVELEAEILDIHSQIDQLKEKLHNKQQEIESVEKMIEQRSSSSTVQPPKTTTTTRRIQTFTTLRGNAPFTPAPTKPKEDPLSFKDMLKELRPKKDLGPVQLKPNYGKQPTKMFEKPKAALTWLTYHKTIQNIPIPKKGIYHAGSPRTGPKFVITHEADLYEAELFWYSGLVCQMYIRNVEQFKIFPVPLRRTLENFTRKRSRGRELFLFCISTNPVFEEQRDPEHIPEVLVPSLQYVEIGINGKPYLQETETPDFDELGSYVNNLIWMIKKSSSFEELQICFADPTTLVVMRRFGEESARDDQFVYHWVEKLLNLKMNYNPRIRKMLCEEITKEYGSKHKCDNCFPIVTAAQGDKAQGDKEEASASSTTSTTSSGSIIESTKEGILRDETSTQKGKEKEDKE